LFAERFMLNITILDTGIGISFDFFPKMFQPFSQVDSSDSRQYGGIGLGLAVSKHLIELMKGSFPLSHLFLSHTSFPLSPLSSLFSLSFLLAKIISQEQSHSKVFWDKELSLKFLCRLNFLRYFFFLLLPSPPTNPFFRRPILLLM
jgi:Histidine kinase-, DNA gyrase B-, and HSP90-like ATPase